MISWRPIAELPDELKDGREVLVKRVYEGRVVKEGPAVFGFPCAISPMLQPLAPDPLGRVYPGVMAAEIDECVNAANTRRWLNADRMHAFPEPTHFAERTPP